MRQQFGMFQDILSSLFDRRAYGEVKPDSRSLDILCKELLTSKGEVSGYRIAKTILDRIETFDSEETGDFFTLLASDFDVNDDAILAAGNEYRKTRSAENLAALMEASEPKRQELLRRLNQLPGATARLVKLRETLLRLAKSQKDLARVDLDFQHLFHSWFNRGFLVMRRIDWQTPASILEKIIQYEAVHEIDDWDDLRRRLEPEDRRCYGFFHPSMPDDPLIFVQVALTDKVPNSVQDILSANRSIVGQEAANTAVFYSISNCQKGLRGVSFGNFLIKQVVKELENELPNFETFITLSPLPGFLPWLESQAAKDDAIRTHTRLIASGESKDPQWLRRMAARYLYDAKNDALAPLDPVARFHLNNGALIENIHANADLSANGLKQSAGVMVNYLYDPKRIEKNHEAYATGQTVVVSSGIKNLLAENDVISNLGEAK